MEINSWANKVVSFLAARRLLNWMPDKQHLKILFWARMGEKLNLHNPITFNEKMQWLKLYDRKPIYTTMVDKYAVKKYVADKIGEDYIVPTLGVWDQFDDIDFDSLPEQFVLKCTHDSGGLAICRDKCTFDFKAAKSKLEDSLKRNYYWHCREWPYKNVKPRIIAEVYLENKKPDFEQQNHKQMDVKDSPQINQEHDNELTDYKFYCFNGEPQFLYVSRGLEDHSTAQMSFLTLDWQFADFRRGDYIPFDKLPPKPINYNEMLELAKKFADGFLFLRVDFYEVDQKIYFSELTFTPVGGYMPVVPKEWDKKLGDYLKLPTE